MSEGGSQKLRGLHEKRVAAETAEEEVARLRAALLEAQDEAGRRREANAALREELRLTRGEVARYA